MHSQISGPAQISQRGSAGPPAMQAARQGPPTPSQIAQDGGMVIPRACWSGVAETRVRAAAAKIPKTVDFILRDGVAKNVGTVEFERLKFGDRCRSLEMRLLAMVAERNLEGNRGSLYILARPHTGPLSTHRGMILQLSRVQT
jgi:hypothetical protein